jgi:hypothetical protein
MPVIGRSDEFYTSLIKQSEAEGSRLAVSSAKVGQYLSLALRAETPWETKTKYFSHVLRQHCRARDSHDEDGIPFFQELAGLVRAHAGQEALRLASTEDDLYATRLGLGADRNEIESEAETFFSNLLGAGDRPDWFNEEDWLQLRMLRDQWI